MQLNDAINEATKEMNQHNEAVELQRAQTIADHLGLGGQPVLQMKPKPTSQPSPEALPNFLEEQRRRGTGPVRNIG